MRWGVIARSDDRGLGIQGWELVRNLQPDRVLVVDLHPLRFPAHPERYPSATFVRTRDGALREPVVREWLDGLDVVVFAETPYDWRICGWAREQACATVCWVNPEFHRYRGGTPSTYWAPSTWRLEHLPEGTRHVPVPCPIDRWPDPPAPEAVGDPLRWLHVGGVTATGDRNGASIMHAAASLTTAPGVLTMRAQDRQPGISQAGAAPGVRRISKRGTVRDYWRLYDDQDVLVMPRRFGGLSLPVIEACGAGLAVVMTGCPPNFDWPIEPIEWDHGPGVSVPAGRLTTADAHVPALASLMDEWAHSPELVVEARRRARTWAEAHSWAALEPVMRCELERAADRP